MVQKLFMFNYLYFSFLYNSLSLKLLIDNN